MDIVNVTYLKSLFQLLVFPGKVYLIRRGQTTGNVRTVQFVNVDNLKHETVLHSTPDTSRGEDEEAVPFIISRKGGVLLVHEDFLYRSNLKRQGRERNIIYWECVANRKTKCRGRVKTIGNAVVNTNIEGTVLVYLFMCISFYN